MFFMTVDRLIRSNTMNVSKMMVPVLTQPHPLIRLHICGAYSHPTGGHITQAMNNLDQACF